MTGGRRNGREKKVKIQRVIVKFIFKELKDHYIRHDKIYICTSPWESECTTQHYSFCPLWNEDTSKSWGIDCIKVCLYNTRQARRNQYTFINFLFSPSTKTNFHGLKSHIMSIYPCYLKVLIGKHKPLEEIPVSLLFSCWLCCISVASNMWWSFLCLYSET